MSILTFLLIFHLVLQTSGIPMEELWEHLFILRDKDATQHLFRVASGLDSLVLGEGQILAQVKQVFKVGQTAVGFGRNLTGLVKQALLENVCGAKQAFQPGLFQ